MAPPNVVLICCDDLGYGDLSCYGADFETPHIDALAADGTRFTDWHSNAPVCSPSRASLLTGHYPQSVGVTGNVPSKPPFGGREDGLSTDTQTIATRLSTAGYATGAVGKWHLGMGAADSPGAHGFDDFFGFRAGCVDYYSHLFIWGQGRGVAPFHDLWTNDTEAWHNGEYLTDLITDRSLQFIEDHQDEPFFLYTAYNAPHYPLHAPEEYLNRFRDLDPERRAIAAMIAGVDDGIGAIREALRTTGQAAETVIVFTSDHGPSREVRNHLDGSEALFYGGSTGGYRGHKASLFEAGIRVPGIVSLPGVEQPEQSAELVLSMDVAPTMLSLCGESIGDEIEGADLTESVLAGDESPHDTAYWAFGDQLAVRRGDWKLVCAAREDDGDPDPRHLSNLDADPEESDNAIENHESIATDLESIGREWLESVS